MHKKKAKLPVEGLKSTKAVPVRIVNDGPSTSYAKEDQKWRAEDDLRALQRAREIEGDKSRMKAAKAVAKEQMNTLKKCL
jgi:hypothetical protein